MKNYCADFISTLFETFQNKALFRYHAKEVLQHPLILTYKNSAESFLENIKLLHVKNILLNSNTISSNVFYIAKIANAISVPIKAGIASGVYEEMFRHPLKRTTACANKCICGWF